MFQRRKKTKTDGSQGTHTVVHSSTPSFTEPLLTATIDASPTNVEKQPHSLSIPPPTPHSHISSEIAMTDNQGVSNSSTLQLREEPTLQIVNSPTRESSILDHLNTNSPTIEKLTKIFTSTYNTISTSNITSKNIISSTNKLPSMDISHMLITKTQPMDIHQSMDTPPSEIIAQTLLGLKEWSELESERHDCILVKGEEMSERTPTSSGGAKGEIESTTLEGEDKGEAEIDV